MTKKARHDLSLPEPLLRMIEARSTESGESKNQCIQKLIEKGLQFEKVQLEKPISDIQQTTDIEPLLKEIFDIKNALGILIKNQTIADTNSQERHDLRKEESKSIIDTIKTTNNNITAMDERTSIIVKCVGDSTPKTINQILYFVSHLFFRSSIDMHKRDIFGKDEISEIEQRVEKMYNSRRSPIVEIK